MIQEFEVVKISRENYAFLMSEWTQPLEFRVSVGGSLDRSICLFHCCIPSTKHSSWLIQLFDELEWDKKIKEKESNRERWSEEILKVLRQLEKKKVPLGVKEKLSEKYVGK